MIRSFGYYASSKGMVLVPSLSGLNSTQIQTSLAAVGLLLGNTTNTSTGATSENNGKFASSTPAVGTLVDYGTSVDVVLYQYTVTPSPSPGPSPSPEPTPTVYWFTGCCDQSQLTRTSTVSFDEAYTSFVNSCSGTISQAQSGSYSGASNIPSLSCSTTPSPGVCLNTYSFLFYDGGCNYDIYDCNGTKIGSTRVTSCSSPGVDSSGATIPGCSDNCTSPSPSPGPSPSPDPSPSPSPAPTFGFFR